ncbi:dihydroneopterin aldolase [bacterium]|nr:MAG: dihydroneopterin aldolase [bacterium]
MKTKLVIHDLKIPVSIGVHEWEKQIKQELIFNLELEYNAEKAMQTDDVQFALDYTVIGKLMNQVCERKHFELIEHLAHELQSEISTYCLHGKLDVFKADVIPSAKGVSFICEW